LSSVAFAQDEMRVIDSLESVMATQEGREKVLTMIELSKTFFDFSFDDCVDWGERAITEAERLGFDDLEADATFSLGELYGDHADNDLAQNYLREARLKHLSVGKEKEAIQDLWLQAYYEQVIGNIDTAYTVYEQVIEISEKNNDSLLLARALSNISVIQYQLQHFNMAEKNLLKSRDIYVSLKDTLMVTMLDLNLAGIYMECGKTNKAKKLFMDVIPKIEAICDFGWLIVAYKNYGQLFVKGFHDFDSASYYYEKAYSIIDFLDANGVDVPVNSRVDLLVEMGNASYNNENYRAAENWFIKAFELSESSSNASGQMMACLGLGLVYSYLSQPSKSLHYLDLIDELEAKSGISIAYSTIKVPLILNYARLGKFDVMELELKDFKDEWDGLLRENNDLYDQLSTVQDEMQSLLRQYESQSTQIETLQSERNHYRLAFFGLLAIALFTLVLFVAYKIVRKNRANKEKG
jgi:tetratricopeptide (TPR) repeat protein